MTTYDWSTIRAKIIEITNDTPHPHQENDIIEVFQRHPAEIFNEANRLCALYQQGTVRSVWAVLHKISQEIDSRRSISIVASPDREEKIGDARRWVRRVGYLCPSENELYATLFGGPQMTAPLDFLLKHEQETRGRPGRPMYEPLLKAVIRRTRQNGPEEIPNSEGPLYLWRDDTQLVVEMVTLWRELHPRAEQLEREAIDRATHWKNARVLGEKPISMGGHAVSKEELLRRAEMPSKT